MSSLTACDIVSLIQARHSQDVVVPECKDGPSQTVNGHLRMDAWVMRRSWSDSRTIGYEVKVSRSDFLKDDKWHNYLSYCNNFYFVCPWKLIAPEECPEQAGLIWVSKTGTRLYTKRKAPFNADTQIPETLWRYILMCRVDIREPKFVGPGGEETQQQYWERWLRQRKVDREFGLRVGKTIRETVSQRIDEVESENKKLKRQNEALEETKQALEKLGIDPDMPYLGARYVERAIEQAQAAIPSGLPMRLRHCIRDMKEVEEAFTEIQTKQAGGES